MIWAPPLESAEADFVLLQPWVFPLGGIPDCRDNRRGMREVFVCWDAPRIGAATGRRSEGGGKQASRAGIPRHDLESSMHKESNP